MIKNKINRSAKSGKFVTEKFAKKHKATTVGEKFTALKKRRENPLEWMDFMRKEYHFTLYVGGLGYKVTMVSSNKISYDLLTGFSLVSIEDAIKKLIDNFSMHNLKLFIRKEVKAR